MTTKLPVVPYTWILLSVDFFNTKGIIKKSKYDG